MKRIGMIVAVEMEALLARYGQPQQKLTCGGFPVMVYEFDGYELVVLNTGAGELAAAAGTQVLISELGVDLVVNYGVVGGLTDEMSLTRTCVVESVVHYDFDTSAWNGCEVGRYPDRDTRLLPATRELVEKAVSLCPTLKRVVCASGDKFVEGGEKKRELHSSFGADICEMEAAGVVLTCLRCGVPCLLIKTVSDGLSGGGDEFERELLRASGVCLDIADSIIRGLEH